MEYYIRLDDASDHMNIVAWARVEGLFDQFGIKPLVGIIPLNQDKVMTQKYKNDPSFWNKVQGWLEKGWTPALHGFNHRLTSKCGGINPVNPYSEFAGVPLKDQKAKIREGITILRSKSINPTIFFCSWTYL